MTLCPSYLFLHFLFVQNVRAGWPLQNSSAIQLLGLFPDANNSTETSELSIHSRAMFQSAILLAQKYNITINDQYISWQSEQTGGKVMNALRYTCQALSSSTIAGIVGPASSNEAEQIANFGSTIGLPVISYSATDSQLSNRNAYPTFYRTVPSDDTTAMVIAELFLQYNWTNCIVVYQNDPFGIDGVDRLSAVFVSHGLQIGRLIEFDISTNEIQGNLKDYLMNSPTRIVLVWADESSTSYIIQIALNHNVLGPKFLWILTSTFPLTSFHQNSYENLIGIITIELVTGNILDELINSTLLNSAYDIWKQNEPETFPLSMQKINPHALFAFDATWILIESLRKLCSMIEPPCLIFNNSSLCFDRLFLHSDQLLNTINSIEFLGVSGLIRFHANTTDRVNGSYYYVQNLQLISNNLNFIPVLQYSDNWQRYSEANVIRWPGNSLQPPTGQASLEGITLRIGVIEAPVFTIVNDRTTMNLTGYVIDLIELLRTEMNFIADIQLASVNQTYSGLIQAVANGVYDIVVGDVTVSSGRRKIVDFSNSIFDNSLRLMVRKVYTNAPDPLAFLKPFSFNLWITFLFVWIFASLLFCFVERETNDMLQNRSFLSQVAMSLWYTIGHCIGHGVDFHVSTPSGRLLTVGLYMLSLVLIASYTANLASDLTIMKSQSVLSGIDDLKNGKIPANRIGIRVGTAAVDYYLKEISNGNANYYPLYSLQQGYDDLLANTIDVLFTDIGVGEYITDNIYCNLTLVGNEFDTGTFGIVLAKDWIYTEQFDVTILSLGETGLLDNLKMKWFQTSICPDTTDTPTTIEVQSVSGLFAAFAVVVVLSLILFAWRKRHVLKNCSNLSNQFVFRKRTYDLNQSNSSSNHQQNQNTLALSAM
ncbi:unnamed protein product [Adineta ricciae]|uniref:Ionotropic glutamate receptor C-terminal domain-containing protein n=1 Tax=Adineta ricciae TaxID=249248 RepID=A0A813RUY0_ADIRI|nr:unnamed protein product [Adineta ricciae]CAF1473400.1 unnamed protein product [Adineta ricciae]